MTTPTASAAWTFTRVMAWIEQLEAGLAVMSLFDLLEIPPTASLAHVRQGFHAIAITRHPDVWRNRLSASQLDRLVRVYGRVAAAYATLRDPDERNRYLRTTRDSQPGLTAPGEHASRDSAPGIARTARDSAAAMPTPGADRARPDSRPPAIAAPPRPAIGTTPPTSAAAALGPRAQSYFRRAETAARNGDVAAAVLNLKLAIAAEPTSSFLRNALAMAQAELKK